jgi:hypothetical protein
MSDMSVHLLISPTDIEVVTYGQLPEDVVGYARERMIGIAWHSVEPVRHATVKVGHAEDPGRAQPYRAKATLDLGGSWLRAQVAAAVVRDAVDLLADRLEYRVSKPVEAWESEPGERPEYYPRPRGRREIVRQKTYELTRRSPARARYDMARLDYDFHLFRDARTGREAVVYRTGPAGYRLAQPAALLTTRGAVDRLDHTGQPFLFFVDAATGHGRLLYRRYDGHYGLVRPA